MENIKVNAQRYSFLKPCTHNVTGRHWQHLVAKVSVTMMASQEKIERIVVEVEELMLENLETLPNLHKIECGWGNTIVVRATRSHFQLRLDPREYAKVIEFLKSHKVPFGYNKEERYDYRLQSSGKTSRPSSSNPGSSFDIPSSIFNMESPQSINLCSSPASFISYHTSTSVIPGDFSTLVSRYGILVCGVTGWKFVYKNSFIRCIIKCSTLRLIVSTEMDTIHNLGLQEATVSRKEATIEFSEQGDRIQLRLNKGFIGKLSLLLANA